MFCYYNKLCLKNLIVLVYGMLLVGLGLLGIKDG